MVRYNHFEHVDILRERIRELEEVNASTEVALDVCWDELDKCRARTARWRSTAIWFAGVATLAISVLVMRS